MTKPLILKTNPLILQALSFEFGRTLLLRLLIGVSRCILHSAPGLFGVALDLLLNALDLQIGVTRPLAKLALHASGSVVDRSLTLSLSISRLH